MPPVWMELIKSLGAFGLLGYMVFMIFKMNSHTIPRLAKDFRVASKEMQAASIIAQQQQREDFRAISAEARQQFCDEMKREREIHGQHVERILGGMNDLRAEIRTGT